MVSFAVLSLVGGACSSSCVVSSAFDDEVIVK
jgi:hypothetical protein